MTHVLASDLKKMTNHYDQFIPDDKVSRKPKAPLLIDALISGDLQGYFNHMTKDQREVKMPKKY